MSAPSPDPDHPVTRPVALVTGGSRGIGRATVEALAREGWKVWFLSRRQESVDRALEELTRGEIPGDHLVGRAVDVRDPEALEALVDELAAAEGRLDALVSNAGVGEFGPVDELSPETWRKVLGTNLDGAFFALRAVAPVMRRQGSGVIVHVASLAARNPFAGGAAYNASKYGLLGLSEAAMLDLRGSGVRVTTVLPGSVDTDFGHPSGSQGEGKGNDWKLRPEDVARAVLDLLAYPQRALPSRIELRPTQTGG